MAVAGLRGTGDWGTDERPKNFREFILWRDPNGDAPLTALMSKMRSDGVDDPEFAWWEEELNPIRVQVNGAVTTGQTTVTIDLGDAQDLVAADRLLVEKAEVASYDNELIDVVSVASTTQFTVTRGVAGTTAATIADNSFLTKIGNVFEEGSTSPDASTRNPTKFFNYTQIFKTTYRITETAKKTRARTGPALQNDKKRKAFDHAVALEYAYIFGKKNETTGAAGKPKRSAGGLLEFMATEDANSAHVVKIWTTTPNEDTFLDATFPIWDYRAGARGGGGNERIVLAGNSALNRLNKMAKDSSSTRINYDGTITVFGMNLTKWVLPQGTLFVRTHPLLNVHGRYTKSMFILNPSGIIDRPLRTTKSMANIQANDADEEKGQWLTESGGEFRHLKTMTYQGNFDFP
jgi:hypothetical protein